MNAFPTTACILTMQAPFPDLGDLQGTVGDWGIAAYPSRFGTMRNGLTAVPAPHNPPPPPAPYPFGYQMICAAIDDPATLYQDPDALPLPSPPIPLQDALENGVTLRAQYVEVYGTDLELEIDWPVLAAESVKLKSNLPTLAPAQLANISTRAFVQTGDNVMIGGFVVQGSRSKTVMIRAIGPKLTPYGVTNALADPRLELYNGTGDLIASNDNWQMTIIGGIITTNQVTDIQNSGHAPTSANESAIVADLPPGSYTAIVRGVNSTTGVALVEVYDLDPQVPPGIVPVVPKGIFCMSVSGANGFPDQILNDPR